MLGKEIMTVVDVGPLLLLIESDAGRAWGTREAD